MTGKWWTDDDQLLAALGRAEAAARAVPREFVEAGKAVYCWRDIDLELAVLTHDSALDESPVPATSRSEVAQLRTLTFSSPDLTIELEVTKATLLGQLVPPRCGLVEVDGVDGPLGSADVDEVGCFVIRPIPGEQFRLRCHTEEGANVSTSWVYL